ALVAVSLMCGSLAGVAPVAHAADMDDTLVGITYDTSTFGLGPATPYDAANPPTFQAGQVFWLTITVQNTGTLTWGWDASQGWVPASLLSRNPAYNTVFGTFFIANTHMTDIEPGDTFDFQSGLRAPATPGVYTMTWQAVEWSVGTGDYTQAPSFGDPISITVNVVARTDSPPPAQPRTPGLIDGSDFEYMGSFSLPTVPVDPGFNSETTYFNSGLTLRNVGGEERLILAAGTYQEVLYEVAVPALGKVVGDDLSAVPVAPLRTVFGMMPLLYGNSSDMSQNSNHGMMWYDQANETLYWTDYVFYTAAGGPTHTPILHAGTIASGTLTQTGEWYEPDVRPAPQAAFWSGVTPIPQDFADQYTGGKTLGMGYGGTNFPASSSFGPALAAVDASGPSGSTMVQQPILYYYGGYMNTSGMAVRDGNYFIGVPDGTRAQPASPWLGYWGAWDNVGSGLFIDLPGQQGYLTFTHQVTGRWDYGSNYDLTYDNPWYFYSYDELGQASLGQISGREVTPYSMSYMDLPNIAGSPGQYIAGSAFDPSTRLLYVYAMQAYGQVGCCSKPPLVDVYYVMPDLASIAVTTPPDKTTYLSGDKLDLSGMVVTATYTDGSTKDVTTEVTTDPADGATLSTVGSQAIQVTYTDKGLTQTAGFQVNVAAAATLSSDSSLMSLGVDHGALSPSFDPAVTAYSVNVDNAVTSVLVSATAAGSGATVGGTGPHAVSVGDNPIRVTVTAADGTISTYMVTVTRATAQPPPPVSAPSTGISVATGGTMADWGFPLSGGGPAVGLVAGLVVLLLVAGVKKRSLAVK
ncbi:MAG: cadherin-like beta sandwich domain-containing protein, partial [Propionibacteriaceae bacterium]|nr:cadherin-like beta sandwich domain-containing protein [Propionibacteriaceae bacterium]